MSTRHESVQGPYPFITPATAEGISVSVGVLDVYLIIQGPPTFTGPLVPRNIVELINYIPAGSSSELTFQASKGINRWLIQFTVPNDLQGNLIGEVSDNATNNCQGVVVFHSVDLDSALVTYAEEMEVEPSRTEWHVEQVGSLTFENIERCQGVEDDGVIIPVTTVAGGTLKLEDGYNMRVRFKDGISFLARTDVGKGLAPDLGDSASCPPVVGEEDEFVTTINGLSPINGNIPLLTTNSLGIQIVAAGQVDIVRKQ